MSDNLTNAWIYEISAENSQLFFSIFCQKYTNSIKLKKIDKAIIIFFSCFIFMSSLIHNFT